MALLVVPAQDPEPWPTLGPQVCEFIEQTVVYGPGPLKGLPYVIDPEVRALLHRGYEVYPKGDAQAGRRRFKRVGWSVRKGRAKTEVMAAIAFVELHPDGPVRCDGFDAHGDPVGRPVRNPYIPMLAVTVEQVEELAFGALTVMCSEGPESACFDVTLERIVRLDERGRADGKAVPLSNSPGARDGARTTLNCFDEPHRLYLPRQRDAHTTMDANLPKLPSEDPWSLYVGTAGEPGQNSVAEDLHKDALDIFEGRRKDPRLFYVARWAGGTYDLTDKAQRLAAVEEATGPVGEFHPGQYEDIAEKWERHGADRGYLERVWLNRWVKSERQAFDGNRWADLKYVGGDPAGPLRPRIQPGSLVVAGFDGARFRDSTGLVITEVETGTQEVWGLWERPPDLTEDAQWEVPQAEVDDAVDQLMRTMDVWRLLADPPHWVAEVGAWSGRWPNVVEEWWTNRPSHMARAIRAYREAFDSGAVGWSSDHPLADRFAAHIAAAGRHDLNTKDDDGTPLFILDKIHPDRKYDLTVASVLSWIARIEALKAGVRKRRVTRPRRIR